MTYVWLAPSSFFPHRGGVEELTLQLAKALAARSLDVMVVTNHHPISLPAESVVEGVAVRRVPFPAPRAHFGSFARFLTAQPTIQRALDALLPQPDLIHIQCPSVQTFHCLGYALRHRIPFVLTTQGETAMDADMIYQQSLYMRWSLRLASRFAAEVTACSVWAAQACAQYAPTFTAATTIPNGVDPDQWDVGPLPLLPVLCAWGRHVHQKGFDLAIRAFALLKARAPAARLLVGGAGVETPRLRRIAGAGVEFVGPLDRAGVKALLSMSRVAVVPSRIEPFGIAAVEALAAGRGLVYASNTGLEEATGGVGRGVDVSDPTNLALAMEAELAQPTAAALGRARAGELSWTRVCDAYVGLYRHIETGA